MTPPEKLEEEWRPHPKHPKYLVSNLGRVRGPRKMLRPNNRKGYLSISVYHPGGAPTKSHEIHIWVLETFVGPRPEGLEGCHGDGNSLNNHLSNLRWDTIASNTQDKILHGATLQGKDNPNSLLNDEIVAEIRRSYRFRDPVFGGRQLAEKYGVRPGTISSIVRGKSWKHVNDGAEHGG